uniref:Putative homing endonuclease n=1 Tax=viral metagenome TaxID=1070528 RepID=A0A6M3K4Y2_9ZZZZ
MRKRLGEKHPKWKGGKTISNGYLKVMNPDHPSADKIGYVFQHTLIVEEALGGFLAKGSEVHHVDQNPLNNEKPNLVLCDGHSYHVLLHRRTTALKDCGHADWRKCWICKKYDNPGNLRIYQARGLWPCTPYHAGCDREYKRKLRMNKKLAVDENCPKLEVNHGS